MKFFTKDTAASTVALMSAISLYLILFWFEPIVMIDHSSYCWYDRVLLMHCGLCVSLLLGRWILWAIEYITERRKK